MPTRVRQLLVPPSAPCGVRVDSFPKAALPCNPPARPPARSCPTPTPQCSTPLPVVHRTARHAPPQLLSPCHAPEDTHQTQVCGGHAHIAGAICPERRGFAPVAATANTPTRPHGTWPRVLVKHDAAAARLLPRCKPGPVQGTYLHQSRRAQAPCTAGEGPAQQTGLPAYSSLLALTPKSRTTWARPQYDLHQPNSSRAALSEPLTLH